MTDEEKVEMLRDLAVAIRAEAEEAAQKLQVARNVRELGSRWVLASGTAPGSAKLKPSTALANVIAEQLEEEAISWLRDLPGWVREALAGAGEVPSE